MLAGWIGAEAAMLLKGIVLGLSIAAPVGPIGVLCMKRTLEAGVLAGVAGGLGTALADAAYAALAAFGLAGVTALLVDSGPWLRLCGGVVLLWLAVRTLRAAPPQREAAAASAGLGRLCLATFALTITNPLTILSFAAIFAGLGLTAGASPMQGMALVVGVFIGSMLWWILLSSGVALIRHRLSPSVMRWVNRLAALLLLGFAGAVLWPLLSAF